jgi:hypothetical protein
MKACTAALESRYGQTPFPKTKGAGAHMNKN